MCDRRPTARSDAELFAAATAGGPEAFAPIVERYQDAVFGVALARLRNFHDAQDVAQQAFVEAFQRLGNLKDPSRLGAWLRSVTIHRSIDFLRRRREATAVEDEMVPANEPTPAERFERQELRQRVLAAIGRLSKTQRETTTLFYVNGYSVEDVARIQDVPVGTIKSRLHDAREKLKEQMLVMVENVLKSETPKEDFAGRVFELLTRSAVEDHEYTQAWEEIVSELRRIGAKGVDGLVRAFGSRHPGVRERAVKVLKQQHAPQRDGVAIELLKDALKDPNRKVRRHALAALLGLELADERVRKEVIGLVLRLLLDDPSIRVRRTAGWCLLDWPRVVPMTAALRAYRQETDPTVLNGVDQLIRAILRADDDPDN